MPKLAANHVVSLNHEGNIYVANADGSIDVPDHVEDVARSHGCTTLGAPARVQIVEKIVEKVVEVEKPDDVDPNSKGASDNVDEMKRGELTASLTALGVPYKMPITNEDLRKLLRDELARRFAPKPAATETQSTETAAEGSETKAADGATS